MNDKKQRAEALTSELDSILLEFLQRGSDGPGSNEVRYRFGMACLCVSVLSAALANFSAVMQLDGYPWVFLIAAVAQACVGAYFVDRSTRLARRLLRARRRRT